MGKKKDIEPMEGELIQDDIQPEATTELVIEETIQEVEPVVTIATKFNLKSGQCAIQRKDGKGGICLVKESDFDKKYSDKWNKIESKKK
jgi:hypothetical protein